MIRAALGVAVSAVVLAACGGSSGSHSTTTTTTPSGTSASQPSGPTSSVTTGPVRGKLVGDNHAPKIKTNWPYTVTVTDATGHPLNGTVTIEFTFGSQVVGRDTPPTHPLKRGKWHDKLQFPPPAVGQQIALQAVVHTPQGSITLSWPVTPTK